MNIATCPVADPRPLPAIARGFDAYINKVYQPICDGAHDKEALIAWLDDQLGAWETAAEDEAERPGPEVLWEGGPVRPFPADDVIRWIEQALDRIEAFPESEWARRRAMSGLMQQITDLETAADAEDFGWRALPPLPDSSTISPAVRAPGPCLAGRVSAPRR